MGYAVTLIFAAAGLFAVVVALSGVLYARAGSDPADAIDGPGAAFFVYAYLYAFAAALIFSERTNQMWRGALRTFLRINMLGSLMGTIAAGMLIATTYDHPTGIPTAFLVMAALGQIPGLIWLFRYSREG
jgi:hypothetical protein